MTFSAMKFSRIRLLALLLVAVFSFAAIGAVTVASANDASITKKKKCKKGYKKVGKKCKKKKKAAVKTSDTVASVALSSVDYSAYGDELIGTVTLKKPVTSLKLIAYRSKNGLDFPRETAVQGDGVSLTLSFKIRTRPVTTRDRSNAPTTYWVVADGVKSNILK